MGPGSAMARAERWRSPGAHPDDLPKGYQLAPGGKRGTYGLAILAGCPRERADRATPGRLDGTAGAVSGASEQTRSAPFASRLTPWHAKT